MSKDITFSRRTIEDIMPDIRGTHYCPFCRNRLFPGSKVVKMAVVLQKPRLSIQYWFAHLLCADEHADTRANCEAADARITDEQIRKIWDGIEKIIKERNKREE